MAAASTLPMTAAYDAHKEWLKSVHMAHAEHMARAQPRASPLPAAPMIWARPDEVNDMPSGFSGMAAFESSFASVALADDDFDAPVYRSLSLGMLSAEAGGGLELAVEHEDESPRYRSFGAAMPHEEVLSVEDADRAWLQSMPPLIHRQNARRQSTFTIP